MPEQRERLIAEALRRQNPWWVTGKVPSELAKRARRPLFAGLWTALKKDPAVALVGPRQAGKTTLMYQVIEEILLGKGFDPRRVLFLSFDDPALPPPTRDLLNGVLAIHEEEVLREPLKREGEIRYVFLDEVSTLPGWSRTIKGWYDQKFPLKFVLSDSSNTRLMRGAAEHLVGRVDILRVYPMDFREYVAFHHSEILVKADLASVRNAVEKALHSGEVGRIARAFEEVLWIAEEHHSEVRLAMNRYLLADGYPGISGVESPLQAAAILNRYVQLTLYRDIVREFGVRNPRSLERLVSLIAAESSQRMDFGTLGQTLGLKYETIRDYLDYLESVFLVGASEFYSKSRAKQLRRPRKLYLRNCGIRNALAGALDEQLLADPARLGRVVETVVFDHVLRFVEARVPFPRVHYWQDPKGREVDIVFNMSKHPVGVEVKHATSIRDSDLGGLTAFMEAHPGSVGLVVTKDTFERRGKTLLVPLATFLLAL